MIDILSMLDSTEVSVLDHGYVRLVDVMPRLIDEGTTADTAIVDAARVSYKKGTIRKSSDKGLVSTLMRERHTSPFEQVIFKFEIKLPIFVARQLLRHRTASLNEESARYSEVSGDFYVPSEIRSNGLVNKQSSKASSLSSEEQEALIKAISEHSNLSVDIYQSLLNAGVAREMARIVLPQNMYTSMVWTIDLHNLLHLLKLRTHSGAQSEIQDYANAMLDLISPLVPYSIEPWRQYISEGINLSHSELYLLISSFSNPLSFTKELDLTVTSKQRKEYLRSLFQEIQKWTE